jgi:hypothetical protein
MCISLFTEHNSAIYCQQHTEAVAISESLKTIWAASRQELRTSAWRGTTPVLYVIKNFAALLHCILCCSLNAAQTKPDLRISVDTIHYRCVPSFLFWNLPCRFQAPTDRPEAPMAMTQSTLSPQNTPKFCNSTALPCAKLHVLGTVIKYN